MKILLFHLALLITCIELGAQGSYTMPEFFRTPRQAPLVTLNTNSTISVSSFGATANDGINDIQGITNAINAAKAVSGASNPVKVEFETGTYDLIPPTGENHCIFIDNAEYIVLDGNGAEILLHNPVVGFMGLTNCENVIIQDLFIDYAKLPFTQGKVVATDPANSTFDLQIDEGFPLLNESYFASAGQNWGMLKEESGQLKKGVTNLFPYRGWTQLSGNLFRVVQPNSSYIDQIDVGDYFVQIARNNGKTIFRSNSGKNITYLNITSYASPAGTYNTFNHHEWNIINCKILPKPGRVHSGNADCIHISGGFIGPWVEGCRFEAFSDDAVNMKNTRRDILSVQSPTVLTLKYDVAVGDTICFYNPREGNLLGRVAVTASSNMGNNEYRITLSEPVNITTINDHQSGDKAYIDTRSCESFVFRNDTIRNGRRYGIALQNSYGVIENCLIENVSSCGIRIENFVDWGEGFTAHDIEINNNKFINCGFDKSFIDDPTAGSISASIAKLGTPCIESMSWCGTQTADWKGLKNIRISNNYFEYNKAALNLQNIAGGELIEGQFIHNPNDISLQPGEEGTDIIINNCSDLVGFGTLGFQNPNSEKEKSGFIVTTENNRMKVIIDTEQYPNGIISVFDCTGKKVYDLNIQSSSTPLYLSDLKPGIYILRAATASEQMARKIIIL
jgi:hypothetical protein